MWLGRYGDAVEKPLLFNLQEDPGEQVDLAGEHPVIVRKLMQDADKARVELGDYNRIGSGARFFDEGEKGLLHSFRMRPQKGLPTHPIDVKTYSPYFSPVDTMIAQDFCRQRVPATESIAVALVEGARTR